MNYRSRHLEAKLTRFAGVMPAVLVTGARQAGKSTLLTERFGVAEHIVFDPVIDIGGARDDPEFFLAQHPPPVILDEIQYAPELLGIIKRRIDRDPAAGQYFLTGSQNLAILKSVAESMAGRVVVLDLPFLSLAERCGRGDPGMSPWFEDLFAASPFERLRARPRLPVRAREPTLFSRLWRGGFPRFLDLDDELLPELFSSYLRTYVERDVRRVAEVEDQQLFSRFLALCGALTAQEVNQSHFGREFGITPQTAKRWHAVLSATFQWLELPPYHGNVVKRISKRAKGHLADTGLAAWLQRISSPSALSGHPLLGRLFETHVVLEAFKATVHMASAPKLYHWRTHGGAEVDLLLERDGVFVPVEAKAGARVTRGDTRGINAFRATYPHLTHGAGVIVAAVESVTKLTDDIFAVPYDLA